MTLAVVGLALFAAVLHATWNAFLRGGSDPLWAVAVMSVATSVVAVPVAAALPLPPEDCWPYLLVSAVLQVGYGVFLAFAYRVGEFGQVYPVVRGVVPVMTTVCGFVFAGQQLSLILLIGIGLISSGIISTVLGGRRASPHAFAWALLSGLFVAAYATVDSLGARRAGGALAYVAWIFIIYGAMTPFVFRMLRGRFPRGLLTCEGARAMGGGVISLISYAAVTSALALGPLAPTLALRETSIIFSAVISRLILREHLSRARLIACVAVAAGAACIALA